MILRRISDALKRQDWVTVFIEFTLIFASVILALQFDNWNTERLEKKREHEVLAAIAEDLRANIAEFEDTIDFDLRSVAACEAVKSTLNSGAEWSLEMGKSMQLCSWWTSPYLYTAAYSGLKSNGTDLITNPTLRVQITRLYENTYNYLVNDTDRTFWDYQSRVMMPIINQTITPRQSPDGYGTPPYIYEPLNLEDLRTNGAFMNMLSTKQMHQELSIGDQRITLERTIEVLEAIEAELGGEK